MVVEAFTIKLQCLSSNTLGEEVSFSHHPFGRSSMAQGHLNIKISSGLLLLATALCILQCAQAWSASCSDPYFKGCYGVVHKCPAGCPKACQVDCKFCKPICACDKPGAVCQDPRFIGGDGIMFYFHGKMDEDFCLVSDPLVHVNAHFIGKSRQDGSSRNFTWVQSLGIMFGSKKLYIGANKVAQWDDAEDHLAINLDGMAVDLPAAQGTAVEYPKGRSTAVLEYPLKISRLENTNAVALEAAGLFRLAVRVVPISEEESRVHRYGITPEDCFAHLEINFKFFGLSKSVHGVLGQTYAPGYRSPVKIGVAMPILGGDQRFATSSLFQADCRVSRFQQQQQHEENIIIGLEDDANEEDQEFDETMPSTECSSNGSTGMVCRR